MGGVECGLGVGRPLNGVEGGLGVVGGLLTDGRGIVGARPVGAEPSSLMTAKHSAMVPTKTSGIPAEGSARDPELA